MKESEDNEIANMVNSGKVHDHTLENLLGADLAVAVRRLTFESKLPANVLKDFPSPSSLDYSRAFGTNCEIVVGYILNPVGMVGPLTLKYESVRS